MFQVVNPNSQENHLRTAPQQAKIRPNLEGNLGNENVHTAYSDVCSAVVASYANQSIAHTKLTLAVGTDGYLYIGLTQTNNLKHNAPARITLRDLGSKEVLTQLVSRDGSLESDAQTKIAELVEKYLAEIKSKTEGIFSALGVLNTEDKAILNALFYTPADIAYLANCEFWNTPSIRLSLVGLSREASTWVKVNATNIDFSAINQRDALTVDCEFTNCLMTASKQQSHTYIQTIFRGVDMGGSEFSCSSERSPASCFNNCYFITPYSDSTTVENSFANCKGRFRFEPELTADNFTIHFKAIFFDDSLAQILPSFEYSLFVENRGNQVVTQ